MSAFLDDVVPAELRPFAAPPAPPDRPFRSLEPFRFADASLLTARAREVRQLVRLITLYRGVLLYGESGTGKSSLVNAGLLPELVRDGLWPHRVRVQPEAGAEFALEPIAAADVADGGTAAFLPSAFAGADARGRIVLGRGELVPAVAEATGHGTILLVFDQFEELVTLFPRGPDLSELQRGVADAILELLAGTPGAPEPANGQPSALLPVKLLFSFREDYLASLKPVFERAPDLIHQGLRLTRPPLTDAPRIIRAPFDEYPGRYPPEFSQDLAERITRAFAGGREPSANDETPLSELQIVCSRLYAAPDPAAEFEELQLGGLLGQHLADALSQFAPAARDAAIALLSRLVTASGTRNVVAEGDLVGAVQGDLLGAVQGDPGSAVPGDLADAVARALAQLRDTSGLIRSENRRGVALYELTSESLIPSIIERHRRVEGERERRKQEELRRRQARRVRRQRAVIAICLLAAAVMLVLAIAEIHQRNQARRQQQVSNDLQLAATSQGLLAIQPDASLVLALAAFHNDEGLPEARDALLSALEQARLTRASVILHGSVNTITGIAFDPTDPGRLVSASAGGTIRLWNAVTGHELSELLVFQTGVASVAFSADGRTLAVGGESGQVQFVDASGRQLTRLGAALHAAGGVVASVAFSHSDDWLAAAGVDADAMLVPLVDGRPRPGAVARPLAPAGVVGPVRALAFSPAADTTLAVATDRGVVQLWNAATGAALTPPLTLPPPQATGPLYGVGFDPADPDRLAVAGLSGRIDTWRRGARWLTATPAHATGSMKSLAFSPDGRRLATGLSNGSVQVWDATSGAPVGPPLAGHTGEVTAVAFSPGRGATLAAASTDRTVWLWSMPTPTPFEQIWPAGVGPVSAVAFDPAARTFLASGTHGIAVFALAGDSLVRRTGEIERGQTIRSLAAGPGGIIVAGGDRAVTVLDPAGHALATAPLPAPVYSVAFDPVAPELAFAEGTGEVYLWRYASGPPRLLARAGDSVYKLAFSPDGRELAGGGESEAVDVWAVPSGGLVKRLTGATDAVFSVAFSPDARFVAAGGADDTVRIWRVARPHPVAVPLLGSRNFIRGIAFSPTRPVLAEVGLDGALRLWNTRSFGLVGEPLADGTAGLEGVTFSPDGASVVTGGNDGDVRVWPVVLIGRYRAMRDQVCRIVGVGLSRLEWSDFDSQAPYENPCAM